MCFEIRKARPGDIGAALQLDRTAFGTDAWTFLDYAGVFSFPGVKKFTALVHGRFAGFAAAEYDREQDAVCMLTLAVCPEFRCRGIGGALLKCCEEAFPGTNCYLYVDVCNQTAIRLYKQCGYRQTGVKTAYYMNGHDALVMGKTVTAAENKGS